MCVLSIKVPIRKESGNLFNDPRICKIRFNPMKRFIYVLYDRKRSLLIYRTHKIMIATGADKSIHRMLSVPRLSSKWKKRLLRIGSAHWEMSMQFVKK